MQADIQDQYDKIYRYCYYKVKNVTLAQDLTQETFLRYFSHNSYVEHGKKLAYLYTIARNLCMDSFRRGKLEISCTEIPCEDCIEQLEDNLVLRDAIGKLNEKEQEILLFRYANELSVSETATIMGISRFAVYRLTNSALAALKQILKEDFI